MKSMIHVKLQTMEVVAESEKMYEIFKVIGHYEPSVWNVKLIAEDLISMIKSAEHIPLPIGQHRLHKGRYVSKRYHADLMRRTPKYDRADLDWHQDGDMTGANMDCGIIMWSSNTPTELKKNGEIYQTKKRDVIYFNNLDVYHRRSPKSPKIRWLFRQRVKKL